MQSAKDVSFCGSLIDVKDVAYSLFNREHSEGFRFCTAAFSAEKRILFAGLEGGAVAAWAVQVGSLKQKKDKDAAASAKGEGLSCVAFESLVFLQLRESAPPSANFLGAKQLLHAPAHQLRSSPEPDGFNSNPFLVQWHAPKSPTEEAFQESASQRKVLVKLAVCEQPAAPSRSESAAEAATGASFVLLCVGGSRGGRVEIFRVDASRVAALEPESCQSLGFEDNNGTSAWGGVAAPASEDPVSESDPDNPGFAFLPSVPCKGRFFVLGVSLPTSGSFIAICDFGRSSARDSSGGEEAASWAAPPSERVGLPCAETDEKGLSPPPISNVWMFEFEGGLRGVASTVVKDAITGPAFSNSGDFVNALQQGSCGTSAGSAQDGTSCETSAAALYSFFVQEESSPQPPSPHQVRILCLMGQSPSTLLREEGLRWCRLPQETFGVTSAAKDTEAASGEKVEAAERNAAFKDKASTHSAEVKEVFSSEKSQGTPLARQRQKVVTTFEDLLSAVRNGSLQPSSPQHPQLPSEQQIPQQNQQPQEQPSQQQTASQLQQPQQKRKKKKSPSEPLSGPQASRAEDEESQRENEESSLREIEGFDSPRSGQTAVASAREEASKEQQPGFHGVSVVDMWLGAEASLEDTPAAAAKSRLLQVLKTPKVGRVGVSSGEGASQTAASLSSKIEKVHQSGVDPASFCAEPQNQRRIQSKAEQREELDCSVGRASRSQGPSHWSLEKVEARILP